MKFRCLDRVLAGLLASVVWTMPARAELTAREHVPARSFAGAFLAGDVARQDNDFGSAARYLEEALSFDPENEIIERGLLIALLTDGRFDDAVPLAASLSEQSDVRTTTQLVAAIDAMRKGDHAVAHAVLEEGSNSDLDNLMMIIMRAWALYGDGQPDAALESLTDVGGADWYRLFISYHTGLIALAAGYVDKAVQVFDETLEDRAGGGASPLTYLRVAQARARLAAAMDDRDAALRALNYGFDMAPTNPPLLTLLDTLDTDSARQPLVSRPTDGAAEIMLNLGSAINRDGSETFAALYLELGRALAPDNDSVLFELGSIAERLDQPLKAIAYYDLVPDGSPLKRVAALQQGLNLADLERTEEAITTLEELVARNPSDYRGYLALGGVHSSQENWEAAAKTYETALEHIDNDEPTYWPLHYRLAIAYERMKQWEKAEPRFLRTLELRPDEPDVLNYLGYSWIDMNMNLDEGLEMIRKAVELRPRAGYIVDSLGWAYYRLGRFDEALEQLERAADIESRDPTINDHLGDVYWRVGRKLEATYQWSMALDFDPDEELKAKIRAKLDAANTPGVLPAIAVSISDDPTAGNTASDGTTTKDDG